MRILYGAIIVCSMLLGACSQQKQTDAKNTTTTTSTPTAQSDTAASYRCPVCGYTSDKAGNCPKDKTTLVKVGDYYCPECYMTSSKAEKCPMCGVEMKKMEPATASKE